ncbi:MAG TPA: Gfo/Idh/MocA family oxidoreductase [Pseudolabrys sp.]|nr:Gfo/Idh/MocA family oxidoreductase [Pseudolabrys sp.]
MTAPVRIAVLGAGAIGRRHVEHVLAEPNASLSAIADPAPASHELARNAGVPWYLDFATLLAAGKPDGVIIATPNTLHVEHGLAAVAAGIPALIEKPIAHNVQAGTTLVEAAEAARVPLLVGHHRRHNPMIPRAKATIDGGRLGQLVAVHAFFWLMKPDDYFVPAWRREKGAGPVLINLIHDIDLLRYLCGEIDGVQAQASNAQRGHAVEDSAAILLRFKNGALGTVTASDSAVAPWSWEQTTGENPAYPHTEESCYFIGGTHGSLTVPKLEVWSNKEKRGWFEPFVVERSGFSQDDPLRLQLQHFCRVIRGTEPPLVSGREGLKTLAVIDVIKRATASGGLVRLD